jgi:hypothetical protein
VNKTSADDVASMEEQRTSTPWPPVPARTPESDLRLAGSGTRGGSSIVYRLHGRLDVVYKKYTIQRAETDLARLIKLGNDLDTEDEAFVRRHLAWPRSVVTDGHGGVAGVLLARVPPAFEAALVTHRVRVRDLNYLIYEERAARAGVSPATRLQKLQLLDDVAAVLDWLHRHDLVHEDLAAQNVLWRLEGGAGVLLLDCDSLRPAQSGVDDPLLTSVDWTDPRILRGEEHRPDHASMIYGLGLLAARSLGEPSWRPARDGRNNMPVDRVPAPLGQVVSASVRPDLPRPSVAQWREALAKTMEELDATAALSTKVNPAAVPTAAPPPLAVEGIGAGASSQLALVVGLVLGAIAAAVLILGLM